MKRVKDGLPPGKAVLLGAPGMGACFHGKPGTEGPTGHCISWAPDVIARVRRNLRILMGARKGIRVLPIKGSGASSPGPFT